MTSYEITILMAKLTISMAIFNSYVKLPEGAFVHLVNLTTKPCQWIELLHVSFLVARPQLQHVPYRSMLLKDRGHTHIPLCCSALSIFSWQPATRRVSSNPFTETESSPWAIFQEAR